MASICKNKVFEEKMAQGTVFISQDNFIPKNGNTNTQIKSTKKT
jgi:hypothetical protein